MSKRAELDIGGTKVAVSNLDKVFYPETGFTKGEVIDFYVRVSPYLLPHLRNRPISLKRYPDGVDGFHFYEKKCPRHRPGWIQTADVPKSDGSKINYCVMNGLPSLVWAANLADLELHTFLHRSSNLDRPTALAFDLDPGAPANILDCCQVALWMEAVLKRLGIKSFPKTSGSKGLQIYVPLNGRVTYENTKAFAHAMAGHLEARHSDRVISRMKKSERKGKVFIDWSQNDDKKTTVNVYSLRAKSRPTVSTPVTWTEVRSAIKRRHLLSFEAADVLKRVARKGDLFAPVLSLRQKLPTLQALENAFQ